MFVLYAILVGLIVGSLPGGSVSGLAELRIRWGPVFLGGLLFQVALFSGPVAERIGDLGPVLYVASTAAVLVAVLRNWRIVGLPIVAVGAAANAAAILANGGFMPAGAGALAALGKAVPTAYSNSSIVAHPALAGWTDIFAVPHPLPFANVFSIGDVLIAVGVATVLIAAMRERDPLPPDSTAELPGPAASTVAVDAT
ncbi:MAG TPA: DUF5317 family protein [Candidatus Limnocylindrales bacterium]